MHHAQLTARTTIRNGRSNQPFAACSHSFSRAWKQGKRGGYFRRWNSGWC